MKPGQKAPDFTLPNQDGKNVSLKDFLGKLAVLYFYPKDDTPGCTVEAIDFTKKADEFTKLGAVIVGVSPDSPKSHCKFIEKHRLNVQLLSDESKKVLREYGAWGQKKFMGREYLGVIRSTFLIDAKGEIMHSWTNVKVDGHVGEVLKLLKSRF
ncbi:thioredoxin-dependent thiol peroxidase [Candidatus Woesearchaeota archaeon]|nr:thioredoxin-dependent thiol peroxidase [Candidatus Woesearchaeota archaeon]